MSLLGLIALLFIMSSNTLLGCWAAPPPIVWHKPKGKPYHYSVTREGKVTVTDAKDHEKELWKTQLIKYSGIFSKVYVVEDGKRIVHVRGNHGIRKVTDHAVFSITKEGKSSSFDVSQFIDKLQPGSKGEFKMSTDPQFKWLAGVKKVDKKGITLINASGEEKSSEWKGERAVQENPTLYMKHTQGWTSEVLSELTLQKDGTFQYKEKELVFTGKIPKKEIKEIIQHIASAEAGPTAEDAGTVQFKWIAEDGKIATKGYSDPKKDPCSKLLVKVKAYAMKYSKKADK